MFKYNVNNNWHEVANTKLYVGFLIKDSEEERQLEMVTFQ